MPFPTATSRGPRQMTSPFEPTWKLQWCPSIMLLASNQLTDKLKIVQGALLLFCSRWYHDSKNLWQWMFPRDLGFISLFYKFFQGPLLTHQVFLKLLPTKTERPGSWSWLTLIATHLSTSPTSHEINRVRLKMSEMNRGQTQNVYFLQDRHNEPFIIGSQ